MHTVFRRFCDRFPSGGGADGVQGVRVVFTLLVVYAIIIPYLTGNVYVKMLPMMLFAVWVTLRRGLSGWPLWLRISLGGFFVAGFALEIGIRRSLDGFSECAMLFFGLVCFWYLSRAMVVRRTFSVLYGFLIIPLCFLNYIRSGGGLGGLLGLFSGSRLSGSFVVYGEGTNYFIAFSSSVVVLACLVSKERYRLLMWEWVVFIVACYLLVASGSRASIGGVLVSYLFYLLVRYVKIGLVYPVAFCSVLMAVPVIYWAGFKFDSNYDAISRLSVNEDVSGLTSGRAALWKHNWGLFVANPVLGNNINEVRVDVYEDNLIGRRISVTANGERLYAAGEAFYDYYFARYGVAFILFISMYVALLYFAKKFRSPQLFAWATYLIITSAFGGGFRNTYGYSPLVLGVMVFSAYRWAFHGNLLARERMRFEKK